MHLFWRGWRTLALVGFCAILARHGGVRAGTPEAPNSTKDGTAFFEKSIRPVLVKHCYACHSSDAESQGKLEAGLRLDSKQGLLAGGESGPAIVPGDSASSLLVSALRYDSYQMPPSGRLPADVIERFSKWIDMGAPDPREDGGAPTPRRSFQITDEDRHHWSFQPVHNPPLPKVKDSTWARDELDLFVLARLEEVGRAPSVVADKRALLRRTTYAITGLPPTPEEIASYLADEDEDAHAKVVDRLLASPEFGIHWGRRWLDGVRYSDSVDKSGEYRRWVIQAFNEDLPYDRFLKLQLAGDLFPADGNDPDKVHASGASLDGIVATGMLAHAVWEQVGRDLAVAEIVDSQIDLVGRQLMGLTLACARCHDHKFEPISARDYYALAGIFSSSHIATGKLIADDRLGNELIQVPLLDMRSEAKNIAIDARVAEIESRAAAIENQVPQAVRLVVLREQKKALDEKMEKATGATNKKNLMVEMAKCEGEIQELLDRREREGWDESPPELAEIQAMREEIADMRRKRISAPVAVAIVEGGVPGSRREKIGDAPIHLRGEYQHEGAIVPRRFPTILAGESQIPLGERTSQSGRLELAEWIASPDHPLTARVMVNRIWHQLIGQGIVRSMDNFGRGGESPTHPDLLDHLAHRFTESGWSMKRMVRAILLSSTYRQSSLATPEEAAEDPDNRLLARMNRRRLTYEEFRDSLYFVGGTLAISARTSTTNGALERRAMFEPLDRRKRNVTANMFDGPDPNAMVPARAETTTAPQALFLMNNSAVADNASRLARRVVNDESLASDDERLERLWLLTLGRPPSSAEGETARAFLMGHSWEKFVQVLLATNEFVYLD